MTQDDRRDHPDERERFARGLPDHHDPTAGVGRAPPAVSALTLRMLLAGLAVVLFGGGAIALVATDGPVGLALVLAVVTLVAVVNLVVVARRKRRGEPG